MHFQLQQVQQLRGLSLTQRLTQRQSLSQNPCQIQHHPIRYQIQNRSLILNQSRSQSQS
jgi:hypothetical protein